MCLKQRVAIYLIILILSSVMGCTQRRPEKYSYEFTGLFDTVIQFTGYAKDQNAFEAMAESGRDLLEELDTLYDIYDQKEGVNNIKTINDMAGIQPVKVDSRIIDLIEFAVEGYEKTGGHVNIAMGPVLKIWHDYRTQGNTDPKNARVPDHADLEEAAK
ncbi:MAG TPA: FAD:protein FMN transferase, partial [Clostridiales bacterium]|nr:FAD:protein FMN transferase [Clostridiales bacterium]